MTPSALHSVAATVAALRRLADPTEPIGQRVCNAVSAQPRMREPAMIRALLRGAADALMGEMMREDADG